MEGGEESPTQKGKILGCQYKIIVKRCFIMIKIRFQNVSFQVSV